jgi:hypothetical protein
MIEHKTLKASDRAASDRVPGHTTANDAKRVRVAPQKRDLIYPQMKRSFNDILRSLPVDDFDRETLELDRGALVERSEQVRQTMMLTGGLYDLRKYVRLKAKIAVINWMLSSEVADLIEASLG